MMTILPIENFKIYMIIQMMVFGKKMKFTTFQKLGKKLKRFIILFFIGMKTAVYIIMLDI